MRISKIEEKLYHWWTVKLTSTQRGYIMGFSSLVISFFQAYFRNVLERKTFFCGPDYYTWIISFVSAVALFILWTRGAKDRLFHKENSMHDSLTTLHNRQYLEESLSKLQKQANRELNQKQYTRLVVIFGDMNNFKDVNDSYGHLAGDTAICYVADTMRREIRDDIKNYLCRYGGDEFCAAIMLSNVKDDYAALRQIGRITYRIKRNIQKGSCYFGQTKIPLSMTIGVHFVDVEKDIMSELSKADAEMYIKKEKRKAKIKAQKAQKTKN